MKCSQIALLLLTLCSSATAASSSWCEVPEHSQCNFICDCWDCSDERNCGYHRDSQVWGIPFSCDFEYDRCGWNDISTSSYQWVRDRRSSSMWGSRHHGDHTLGQKWGWFMAAEGHSGKSATLAQLQSPILREAAATCEIHIHYHMWSSASSQVNGSLSVQLMDNTQTYTLWESSRSSVLSWRRAVIYTGRISKEFQVIVTASRDALSWTDIAVDDIEFRHCALSDVRQHCVEGHYHCARGSCVEDSARCDGTDDCGDNSDEANCDTNKCSFEEGTCGWESNWERVDGFKSRPGRDHTANKRSGFFMRALQNSTTASKLISPQLQANGNVSCFLVFYYLLDGSSSSSLVIRDSGDKVLLEKKGYRGPVWLREKIVLQYVNQSFQITFEGVAGGEEGTVALDDLILSSGCKVVNSSKQFESPLPPEKTEINGRESCNTVEWFDFRKGMERWTDVSIGRIKWENSKEGDGTYLSVMKAEGNLNTHAEISSPLLCSVGPTCVLNMTYYFNSGPTGFLNLRAWNPQLGTHSHTWHGTGERSTSWNTVAIPLGEMKQPFQLMLSGSVDPQPGGNWSALVQEIRFIGCQNASVSDKEPVTCNFEENLCGWYQDLTEEVDWKLGSLSDHTTGQGNYMYVEGNSREDRGNIARLISYPQSTTVESQCLSFYHRMHGPEAGTLNIFSIYNGGEEKLIWTSTGTHGNRWHRDSVTITGKQYQLIFEALRDGSVGHIAIDDITITSGACPAPTHCTFEAGICGFSSEGTYTWKLHQHSPSESHNGPYFDHTLQTFTGHYMVIDTSSSSLPRKKTAVLTSSSYSAQPGEACLNFWYQLGGTEPGTLTVYIEEYTGKSKRKRQLLSLSDKHQESWHHKSLALQSEKPWVLMFEAVGAGGDRSFIAVDDIHIRHHRCHEAVTCDFEWGSCAWTNVRIPLMDTYDWDWTYGRALERPNSAPEKDHSPGTPEGHYAFVDTGAMHVEGTSAWLTSEHLQATSGSCFSFWYRTDSQDHSHLAELVLYITSTQGLQPVWVLSGFHSTDWQEQQIQLNSTVEFQIVFEASKGSRPRGAVVALDDVKYTPDLLCNTEPKHTGKSNSGTILAIVLSVIIILLFLLLLFLIYRRWKRNYGNGPSLPEQEGQIDGFDNVSYDQFQNDDTASTSSGR
ncbi:apical endosomal glycoprotein [Mantella aurantiaca]